MFRHFTGLTTLRERPFDIYAGQEDVFGPGSFFTTQSCLYRDRSLFKCRGGGVAEILIYYPNFA